MEWPCCFVTSRPLRVVYLYCMCVCLTVIVNGQIAVDTDSEFQVTAHVGDTITLVCDLRNVNGYEIYWYTLKYGDTISKNRSITEGEPYDRFSIVGNVTQEEFNIKITDVQTSDTDTYQCVYYEYVLKKYTLVTTDLIVLEPPSEDSPKCNASPTVGTSNDFSVGDRVRLQCTTTGGSPVPDLAWYLDSAELASGSAGTLQTVIKLQGDQYDAAFTCVMTTLALDKPQTCVVIPLKSSTTTPSRYQKTATLPPSSKSNDPQVTTQVRHTSLSGRTRSATDDKDPMMQNIILIGAAGGGGFLLLVLLVSIIIAIICCWRKKRTKSVVSKPANRPATGEYEMVNPQPESSNHSKTTISKENPYVTVNSPSKDPSGQSPDGEYPVYDQPGTKDDSRKNTSLDGGGGGETEEYKLVYADLDLNDATDDIIQTDEPTEYVKIKV